MAGFPEYEPKPILVHPHERIGLTRPVHSIALERDANRSRRHLEDEDSTIRMGDLEYVDAQRNTLDQGTTHVLDLPECFGPYDLSGTPVAHSEHDPPAAFVRNRAAVLREVVEPVPVLCLLELDPLVLERVHPLLEFCETSIAMLGRIHAGTSARLSSSAKS